MSGATAAATATDTGTATGTGVPLSQARKEERDKESSAVNSATKHQSQKATHMDEENSDSAAESLYPSAPSPPHSYNPPHHPAVPPRSRIRLPYAIVWGPLPCLSWFIPCIGHMGIADSSGVIHDFNGPYSIGVDEFMIGAPTRFYRVKLEQLDEMQLGNLEDTIENRRLMWDASIRKGDQEYEGYAHNILCQNCHHHVAACFRYMGIQHRFMSWRLLCWILFKGEFLNWRSAVSLLLPPAIIWTIIILLIVYVR